MAAALLGLWATGAQARKKMLDREVFDGWKQIVVPRISDDGRWVVYGLNPARGDGQTVVYDALSGKADTLHRASGARLFGSFGAPWLAAKVVPTRAQQRREQIDKTKADRKRPDTLVMASLTSGERIVVPRLKSFQTADQEGSGVVAYLYEVVPAKDTSEAAKKAPKPKKFNRLVLWDVLSGGDSVVMDSVESFRLSRNGRLLLYTLKGDSLRSVRAWNDGRDTELYAAKIGKTGALAVDDAGRQGAYLVTADTTATGARYDLYWFDTKDRRTALW